MNEFMAALRASGRRSKRPTMTVRELDQRNEKRRLARIAKRATKEDADGNGE